MTTFIKISRNGERFWCEIMGIHDDGRYQARVNNYLVNKTYEFGEIIDIKPEEVIEEFEEAAIKESLTTEKEKE